MKQISTIEKCRDALFLAAPAQMNIPFVSQKKSRMTQELWEYCLSLCVEEGNIKLFDKLWSAYPTFAENFMNEFERIVAQSSYHPTEEETQASWERMKVRLRAAYGEDFI